jgi:hypothetical protein
MCKVIGYDSFSELPGTMGTSWAVRIAIKFSREKKRRKIKEMEVTHTLRMLAHTAFACRLWVAKISQQRTGLQPAVESR